jgi:hypothetical protein
MNTHKKQIPRGFLDIIWGISSKEYQKRVWIEGKGPECDDFDDTVCNFFQLGEPIFDDYKKFAITDSQYCLLKKFWIEFNAFVDSEKREYLEKDFINSPEWTNITDIAKEILQKFHYQKSKDH